MEFDGDLGRRFALGLAVAALFLVIAYVVEAFIGVVVFAIFLYYSVRPIHRFLRRFGLPRRARAALALFLFGVPFVVLLGYTLAIVVIEVQAFVGAYGIQDELVETILEETDVTGIDLDQLRAALAGVGASQSLVAIGLSFTGALSVVSSVFIQLLILVVLTYYMLVDGPRLKEWVLATFDERGVMRRYAEEVDPELSMTLFGNIVNVFVTAIVGVITFYAYNAVAPAAVEVPFPALVGSLAGVGSLIPVFGIKLVYFPVTIGLVAVAVATGETGLLIYVAGFFAASSVFVDFIPDFFIRALISGEKTHTGMLLVSYIVGPAVFGFYGLFLLPILLILAINATEVLLPYVLYGEEPEARQARLREYERPAATDERARERGGDRPADVGSRARDAEHP